MPKPSKGQIVVRNAAVAINPVDTYIQSHGNLMFTHLKYPFVLGYDLAGEVVQVGPGVTRFKVGDRLLAFGRGADKAIQDPAQSAFRQHTVVFENLAAELPAHVDYARGATLPLAVATAAAALFDESRLGLQLPTEPRQPPTGKTVVIWGGSTSVGSNAIQLAIAAGYEVFTTAGSRNHETMRRLGAAGVWDHKSGTAAGEIAAALNEQGKTLAGVVSIGFGAAEQCIRIVDRVRRGNKFIAMATYPTPEKIPQSFALLRVGVPYVSALLSYRIRGAMRGFKSALVVVDPILSNGLARRIFRDFLPKALEAGSYVPTPEPEVVGHGLEYIQPAFEKLRKGVSAKKIVVTL
ncbi:uncharacterized protein THITE_152278 [Thermothielavioides terrestris NRRL 8126]|uniref:Enoyl reductase (ER) domain-containing protein n=1 Tax=Thermothielavioides terrestris (strain ATCC 38088 / NRRL 8126) TaxID=578455 RepID=G2QYC7_THETT|nr:uncharacterized protein THITE_152278 [Thermothielavioides terrestris NRRL 8126]AEO66225.1 hypothetical protein THITE_152278 [Thermothielavioides terrestris NRRL 8126]